MSDPAAAPETPVDAEAAPPSEATAAAPAAPAGPSTSSTPAASKIPSKEVTSFLLGGACAASLSQLSHQSQPYAYGAVTFLLAKGLLKSLDYTLTDSPEPLNTVNRTGSKLARFVPLTLVNAELFRKSGLIDDWNETSIGLLVAASVPTALAMTEFNGTYFKWMTRAVNGVNLLVLALFVAKQRSFAWGAGMGVVCATDAFLAEYIAPWIYLSKSDTRNILRSCFAGLVPFFLKSM